MAKNRAEDDVGAPFTFTVFLKDPINQLSRWLDRNVREVRYVALGLALVGTGLLVRSVRATQKFCTAADLPDRFIRQHVRLQGRVKDVTPSGVLLVDHTPIINWKLLNQSRTGYLRIHPAGTNLQPAAVPWLHRHVKDRHVWFRILSQVEDQGLDCIVSAQKNIFGRIRVNEHLIQEGLATTDSLYCAPEDPLCAKFLERLHQAQDKAEKKGKGVWKRPSKLEQLRTYQTEKLTAFKKEINTGYAFMMKYFSRWHPGSKVKKNSSN